MTIHIPNGDKDEGLFLFPFNYIWWTKVEEHSDLKGVLMEAISSDLDKRKDKYYEITDWNCDISTSFYDRDNIGILFNDNHSLSIHLQDIIMKYMKSMLPTIYNLTGTPYPSFSNLYHIWYNRYDRGNWQEFHDHDGSTFSGIYYLDISKGDSSTSFVGDSYNNYSSMIRKDSVLFGDGVELEGRLVIFPSELGHYVNPSKGNRTTISFNIISAFN
jgi:hypothetical protein